MTINALSNSYTANLTAKNAYLVNSIQQTSPDKNRIDTAASSVVPISYEAQLASIGSKYDVSNMSSKEMTEMAGELKNNGLISSIEYLNLTFVFAPPGATRNENERINYLQQFENRLEFSKRDPVNKNGYTQMLEKMTTLLQNITVVSG